MNHNFDTQVAGTLSLPSSIVPEHGRWVAGAGRTEVLRVRDAERHGEDVDLGNARSAGKLALATSSFAGTGSPMLQKTKTQSALSQIVTASLACSLGKGEGA